MHLYTVLLLCPLSLCVTLKYNPPDIISQQHTYFAPATAPTIFPRPKMIAIVYYINIDENKDHFHSCYELRAVPADVVLPTTQKQRHSLGKSKVELSPMLITCGLNDIVIIAAPVLDAKCLYYVYKPSGDYIKLNLPHPTQANHTEHNDYDNMVVKYINPDAKTIYPIRNSRVIETRLRDKKDVVKEAEANMFGNEFMIGPLLAEDHGNWMLSVFFKDSDDQWMELYQVITIEIVERIPLIPEKPRLRPGSKLRLKFAYPVANLKTCELTAPSSSYDRFFDRSKINLNRCGYVVPNVTKQDEGVWRIIGVGNMIYEGYINLHVIDSGYEPILPNRYKNKHL